MDSTQYNLNCVGVDPYPPVTYSTPINQAMAFPKWSDQEVGEFISNNSNTKE